MTALAVTNPTLSGAMDATLIQQNYTDCLTYLNASVLRKDGTVAMAAALSTSNADPTADAHVVRKAYKDGVCVIAQGTVNQILNNVGDRYTTLLFFGKTRDGTNGTNAANNYNLATGVFTAPIAGLYRFEVGVFNAAMVNDTATWKSRLSINSAATTISGPSVAPSKIGTNVDPSCSFSASWYLAAGDTVAPQVWRDVDSVVSFVICNHFMVAWVHA